MIDNLKREKNQQTVPKKLKSTKNYLKIIAVNVFKRLFVLLRFMPEPSSKIKKLL